jgi:hypothetical protein
MEMESFPSNGTRNACWYFLAQSPSMEIESIPATVPEMPVDISKHHH